MKTRKIAVAACIVLTCGLIATALAQGVGMKSGNSSGQGAKAASVTIKNFEFEPKQLTVKAGTTVTWTNTAGSHTVTADNGSFESPTLSNGQTYSRKFSKPGTYRYYCSFHGAKGGSDMAGVVIVKR